MIKKVLVYTFGNTSHEAAINAAAVFAAKHNAELMGLFVRPDIGSYSTIYGNYPLNLAQTYFETQDDFEKKAKSEFEKVTMDYNINTEWHGVDQYEKVPNPSFYVDFIFVSQPDQESSVIFNDGDFVDYLINHTGLPTVIVPKDWSADSFAERPILGWKESREAVGAVRHTMDLMREANDVDIVSIKNRTDLDKELVEGIEISQYLSEHEIECKFSAVRMIESDHNAADTLLREVENRNRDLIIIGGYGHSRLREIILGGMTRALIKHSPVPVLLSH